MTCCIHIYFVSMSIEYRILHTLLHLNTASHIFTPLISIKEITVIETNQHFWLLKNFAQKGLISSYLIQDVRK